VTLDDLAAPLEVQLRFTGIVAPPAPAGGSQVAVTPFCPRAVLPSVPHTIKMVKHQARMLAQSLPHRQGADAQEVEHAQLVLELVDALWGIPDLPAEVCRVLFFWRGGGGGFKQGYNGDWKI
jgi:hypothetical protein